MTSSQPLFQNAPYLPAAFSVQGFLHNTGPGRSVAVIRKGAPLYRQGDACDSLYYLWEGNVVQTVVSVAGKEGTIALLTAKSFVGEECIYQTRACRPSTAKALTDAVLLRINLAEMLGTMKREPLLSAAFVEYLLQRTSRIQEDLLDLLLHSSEKRLARTLILLADSDVEGRPKGLVPPINQETLAELIGCTRSRVNFYLNRFRRLGLIDYADQIRVNASLERVILQDDSSHRA